MKKTSAVIAIVLALVVLAGCGSPTTTSTAATTAGTSIATVAATTTSVALTTTATTTVPPTTATTTTAPTTTASTTQATTTAAKVGSRSNPAPIGTPISVTGTIGKSDIKYAITMLEIIRGDKASQMVMKENRFNKIPAGKEVILAKFKFELVKHSGDDDYFTSSFDFDYFDKTMTAIKSDTLVAPDEFEGKMFEGGSVTGYANVTVTNGEKVLARYDELVWFNLG